MYIVKYGNDIIHNIEIDKLILQNPIISQELNVIDSLTFTIPSDHDYYDSINYGKKEITVLKNNVPIYIGFVDDIDIDFYLNKTIYSRSILAYLEDTIYEPYNYNGKPKTLLESIITSHNKQTDTYKQFSVGEFTVIDDNDYIAVSSIDYTSSYNVIVEKIVNLLNGYIYVDYTNRTINIVGGFNDMVSQKIEFAENMIDLTRAINKDNFCTRLIPLGSKTEDIYTDIKSVNGGLNYIQNDENVEKFGIITKTKIWDDVTVPLNLKNKAIDYLQNNVYISEAIDVTAVDLSNMKKDIDSFKIGYNIQVISNVHNINDIILITKKETHLTDPSSDKVTLGFDRKTLTASTSSSEAKTENALTKNDTLIADQIKGVINMKNVNLIAQLENAQETDIRAILFEVNDETSPMYGALSLGTQGIQISRSKNADGNWVWGTAIDFQSIHAQYIVTGIISDKFGKNTWNLDTGKLITNDIVVNGEINSNVGNIGGWVLNDDGMSSQSVTDCSTYTLQDAEKIINFLMGKTTLTPEEIERLDIRKDGYLHSLDYVTIKNILSGEMKNKWTYNFRIDPNDAQNFIKYTVDNVPNQEPEEGFVSLESISYRSMTRINKTLRELQDRIIDLENK